MFNLSNKTRIIIISLMVVVIVISCIYTVFWIFEDEINATIASYKLGIPQEHDSYAGVFLIPSVEVELPCIKANAEQIELTKLAVDATSCGAVIWCGSTTHGDGTESGNWLICDHNWQGFSAIMDCKHGDTVSFADVHNVEYKLVVKDMFEGFIGEYGIPVDRYGESFLDSNPNHVILMTCYPDADVPADREDRRFFVYLELVQE